MSGRHRNDFPEGTPDDGGHDPSRPVFGPANDGSSDWFGPRDSQSPPVVPPTGPQAGPPSGPQAVPPTGPPSGPQAAPPSGTQDVPFGAPLSDPLSPPGPAGQAGPPAAPGSPDVLGTPGLPGTPTASSGPGASSGVPGTPQPGTPQPGTPQPGAPQQPGAAGTGETHEWFVPRPGEEPAFGAGGFTGASDAGGYGLGRPPGTSGQGGGYGTPAAPPPGARVPEGSTGTGGMPLPSASAQGPGASSSGGYGGYDSIRNSDGGETGFFGGRAGGSSESGGYGGSGGSGSGSGGSGGYGGGSGDYEYGRRKRKRSATALIGPMAGAVGLALLLGVGVYAFAESGGGCDGDGALTLNVAAAPDIQPAVVKAAGRFNDAKHKISGKCVKTRVTRSEPASVATLLSGQGVAGAGNERPDVWIPDTSMWTSMVRGTSGDDKAVQSTKTSLAMSPIVVGLPQTLANRLKQEGITAAPSWDNLLKAAGGTAGGGVTKNQMIPAGSVRLLVPDPARNAAGMGGLMVTNALLANDPNKESIFTGIVRTVRESTVPNATAQFGQFRKGRTGKQPISLSSEQALWNYNRTGPSEPAVALYPQEGTLSLDYPYTVTTGDGDRRKAAGLLEKAMNTETTRDDVRSLGFRSPDGKAPGGFTAKLGVSPARPRQLPPPSAKEVSGVMQAWSKLTLGLRMLTLIDVSGSMAEKVGGGKTRLQAIAEVSQGGLSMMSNDTELGQWLFSTKMDGAKDYRQSVSVGPLGERVGSSTRRNLVLSTLNQMRPKMDGNTGLYDSVLAAYKEMNRTYKPEFGNSILLLTDGKNDDTDGPTLEQTLDRLKRMIDPNKPIQVNMIGFGKGVDRNELERIAKLTNGNVQIAMTPQEISKIFLRMLSRRITQ
ncbi:MULTISPECIES: substrate-binding domain-containing protein [Actinomadura]|uniref:Substrate-binding domain-containing protein n=2 Tax=Actinomadura yumaensis TaxID=111807 RepID=A0ABW2CJA2_9ACTN|nr:substrate-binding domain-containing protein [Actinomadura sp. J1-007]